MLLAPSQSVLCFVKFKCAFLSAFAACVCWRARVSAYTQLYWRTVLLGSGCGPPAYLCPSP